MTLIPRKYSDGAMVGKDFVIEFLSEQITAHQLRGEVKHQAAIAKAREEELRQLALIAPVLLDALQTHRAALQGFGLNGAQNIRAVKDTERAALLVRIIHREYGDDNHA